MGSQWNPNGKPVESEWVLAEGAQATALPAAVEEEDEGEVDETGVEPKDVELVMTQVHKSQGCQ